MITDKMKRFLRASLASCALLASSLLSSQAMALECEHNVTNDWGAGFTGIGPLDGRGWRSTSAVAAATRQGRIMLWSADPEEQEVLAGSPVAGELHGDRDGAPVVGVYLHDRTAAKMGFYQRMKVRARAEECRPDGGQTLRVEVTVSSTAPALASMLARRSFAASSGAAPIGRTRFRAYSAASRAKSTWLRPECRSSAPCASLAILPMPPATVMRGTGWRARYFSRPPAKSPMSRHASSGRP